MILSLLVMFHVSGAWAGDSPECPPAADFKFSSIELKLNLAGQGKADVLARFHAEKDGRQYYRRALIFNAPNKIQAPTDTDWVEECQEGGDEPALTTNTYEKVKVGERDLLLMRREGGSAGVYQYFAAEEGKLKSVFRYSNPSLNGQFNESAAKGKVLIRIVGDGDLEVGGEKVDLDQRALKLRCRVRELHIQIKYEWDRKMRKFKEVDDGCVMDSAID